MTESKTAPHDIPWLLIGLVILMPFTTEFWVPLMVGPYAGAPHCPEWILSALKYMEHFV